MPVGVAELPRQLRGGEDERRPPGRSPSAQAPWRRCRSRAVASHVITPLAPGGVDVDEGEGAEHQSCADQRGERVAAPRRTLATAAGARLFLPGAAQQQRGEQEGAASPASMPRCGSRASQTMLEKRTLIAIR